MLTEPLAFLAIGKAKAPLAQSQTCVPSPVGRDGHRDYATQIAQTHRRAQMAKCFRCGKRPAEIQEYVESAEFDEVTPEAFVEECEGTYNPNTGYFCCTDCYIAIGCPSAPGRGWRAPAPEGSDGS